MSNVIEGGVNPPSEADLVSADITFKRTLEQPASLNFFQRAKRWTIPYLASVTTTLLAIACGAPVKAGEQTSQVNLPLVGKEAPGLVAPTTEPAQVQISPVEQAIKEGKIEIKQPQEWEKYFTSITPQQAEELLTDPGNKNKMVLPLSPKDAPNLMVDTIEFQSPFGRNTVIGIKNIPVGTVVYSPISGEGRLSTRTGVGGTLAISTGITTKEGMTYGMGARREGHQSFVTPDQPTQVGPGSPLFSIGIEDPLGFYPKEQQLILTSYRTKDEAYQNTLDQLLRVEGKIAFISTEASASGKG